MLVGVAETKEMDPIAAAATVTVPLAERFVLPTNAVAVTTSVPEHPLATYVAVALPVLVAIAAWG
jgi:hypothetical protein